jgi:SsrA-binding protein
VNKERTSEKLIAGNKKAYHDFFIEETYQAGVELAGTEVKSLRQGRCNIRDSYVELRGGEAFVVNMHISPYDHGNIFNRDPLRKRRLLLHRWQIDKLSGKKAKEGFTVVPTRIYFAGSLVKIDVALAKGKKLYDKRADQADKDRRREAERALRDNA